MKELHRHPGYISDQLRYMKRGERWQVPNNIGWGCIPATCAHWHRQVGNVYKLEYDKRLVIRVR